MTLLKKYNITYHRTVKMKPVVAKSETYIVFNKENNYECPKSIDGDYFIISKYINIFPKVYVPNWSKEVFIIKKVKNALSWIYLIEDLNREEIVETLYEK